MTDGASNVMWLRHMWFEMGLVFDLMHDMVPGMVGMFFMRGEDGGGR